MEPTLAPATVPADRLELYRALRLPRTVEEKMQTRNKILYLFFSLFLFSGTSILQFHEFSHLRTKYLIRKNTHVSYIFYMRSV